MDTVTHAYRAQNLALRAQTTRDLQRLWPALDWREVEQTFPVWFVGAAALVNRDARRAVGLASRYLRAHRMASGVPGDVVVKMSTVPAEKLATSLRVTTLVAIKRATMAGQTPQQAMTNAFVQSSGAATRLVLDAGRDTIRQTVTADSRTAGWRRVTAGGCSWCSMLASRGSVYSEATVDFPAHDHCVCSAEPVYR